jgi:hypothetical protein
MRLFFCEALASRVTGSLVRESRRGFFGRVLDDCLIGFRQARLGVSRLGEVRLDGQHRAPRFSNHLGERGPWRMVCEHGALMCAHHDQIGLIP